MAVPTITAISPSVGATGGRSLVEITGTGFRTWTVPAPSTGPSGPIKRTVMVTFGGMPAERVAVVSATRIFCVVPKSPLEVVGPSYGEGEVDVQVQNLDDDEDPIAGELATAVDGYRYQRVQLAIESELVRLTRALIRELRLQVIANVSHSTHTDWDPDSADLKNELGLAELPGLALIGPELAQNRFHSLNQRVSSATGVLGEMLVRRVPYTVDLSYQVVGISDLKKENLNLIAVTQGFFELNKWLEMLRDPADPSKGVVRYQMALEEDGDMRADPAPSASNLRIFSGKFRVRGFDLEDLAGFPGQQGVSRTHEVTEDPSVATVALPPEE